MHSLLLYYRLRRQGVAIGSGTILSALEIEGPGQRLRIGDECAIGRVAIQLHDQVTIGDFTVLSDGVRILTGSHNVHSVSWELVTRPVLIADHVWIAMQALVMPGITLGEGCVVGAGAIVTKDIEPYCIVAGNPARVIGQRPRGLHYHPARGFAAIEAWLGSGPLVDR